MHILHVFCGHLGVTLAELRLRDLATPKLKIITTWLFKKNVLTQYRKISLVWLLRLITNYNINEC